MHRYQQLIADSLDSEPAPPGLASKCAFCEALRASLTIKTSPSLISHKQTERLQMPARGLIFGVWPRQAPLFAALETDKTHPKKTEKDEHGRRACPTGHAAAAGRRYTSPAATSGVILIRIAII